MDCSFPLSAYKRCRPMIEHDAFANCPKTQRIAAKSTGTTPGLPVKKNCFKGFGAVARKSL